MLCWIFKLTAVLILLYASPKMAFGQADATAPPTMLDVYVDGVHYHIKDGDTLKLPQGEIVVKSSDIHEFNYGVLRFYYPSHFSLIYEEDIDYKNWTLDGNDYVIMYFETHQNTTLSMLVEGMEIQFGKSQSNVKNQMTRIGKLKLKGKRIAVNLVGIVLTIDIYELKSNDGKSHFIAFQDILQDDGSPSIESQKALAIINSSISYKP